MNTTSKEGEYLFYTACSNSLESVNEKMQKLGAKVGRDNDKYPPLSATWSNHSSMAQLLTGLPWVWGLGIPMGMGMGTVMNPHGPGPWICRNSVGILNGCEIKRKHVNMR